MGKGFAFPRTFGSEKSMIASLARNNRELETFLNGYVVTTDDDGNVDLGAGNLTTTGTVTGKGAGARMWRVSSDISVPGTTFNSPQIIDWNYADPYGSVDYTGIVNNRFTVPAGFGGVHTFGCAVQWTTAPGGYRLSVSYNGGTLALLDRADNNGLGNYASIGGSYTYELGDGDYVDFRIEYSSTGVIRGSGSWSYAWIAKS